MSEIKKSERKESKLQTIHNAYMIRMAVTNLAENNFYITFSKIEEKINNRIKGLDEKKQISPAEKAEESLHYESATMKHKN